MIETSDIFSGDRLQVIEKKTEKDYDRGGGRHDDRI